MHPKEEAHLKRNSRKGRHICVLCHQYIDGAHKNYEEKAWIDKRDKTHTYHAKIHTNRAKCEELRLKNA